MAIYTFETLDSTNLYLKQNFDKYKHFDIILAEHQTNGYGRFKRNWIDLGSDNIFMSLCLKVDTFNKNLVSISQFTALILAKTFELYSAKPNIKWPNDILIDSKKIAGILAESVITDSQFKGIVLGIGVNLNSNIKDLSLINQNATSLNLIIGKQIDKIEFINKFLEIFKKYYLVFLSDGFKYFKNDYETYLNCISKVIHISDSNNSFTGIVKGINDYGQLKLDIDEKIKEISSGDISFT